MDSEWINESLVRVAFAGGGQESEILHDTLDLDRYNRRKIFNEGMKE